MTPRRLTERPQARSAARHASEPMATPRFAVFSSLLFNRWDPCKPSQNVSADMPSTTKSGSQDSTASRAGKSALRMLSIIVMKLVSSVTRVSGMLRRGWWLVTPQGPLPETARAVSRQARCSDGRAAPPAGRFGGRVGGHDERHRGRPQEHAGSLRERAQEIREEMIDRIDHIVLTTRDRDACIRF